MWITHSIGLNHMFEGSDRKFYLDRQIKRSTDLIKEILFKDSASM